MNARLSLGIEFGVVSGGSVFDGSPKVKFRSSTTSRRLKARQKVVLKGVCDVGKVRR